MSHRLALSKALIRVYWHWHYWHLIGSDRNVGQSHLASERGKKTSFTKFYRNFQTNCYIFVTQGKKTVLNRLHIDHSYLTHSFILRKEEAPVCVACNAVITVKHFLIKCADLLEIRKKYFKEKSLYSLFRNVIPVFFSCERLMCFTKYEVF